MDSADRITPEVVEAKAERLKEKIEIRSLQVHVPPSLTTTCQPLPVSVKVGDGLSILGRLKLTVVMGTYQSSVEELKTGPNVPIPTIFACSSIRPA